MIKAIFRKFRVRLQTRTEHLQKVVRQAGTRVFLKA